MEKLHPCFLPCQVSLYECTASLVVNTALSARGNATYCIVMPREWRIAMEIFAMWSPHRTAAVANLRRRLWIVALPHCNTGAYFMSILAMKLAVIGTIFPLPRTTIRYSTYYTKDTIEIFIPRNELRKQTRWGPLDSLSIFYVIGLWKLINF